MMLRCTVTAKTLERSGEKREKVTESNAHGDHAVVQDGCIFRTGKPFSRLVRTLGLAARRNLEFTNPESVRGAHFGLWSVRGLQFELRTSPYTANQLKRVENLNFRWKFDHTGRAHIRPVPG